MGERDVFSSEEDPTSEEDEEEDDDASGDEGVKIRKLAMILETLVRSRGRSTST